MKMPPGKLGSYRLAAWIFPTRFEGVLFRFVGRAYDRDPRGENAWSWLGGRADDLQVRISRARAWWHWRQAGRP